MPVTGTKKPQTDWNDLLKDLRSQAKARDDVAICRTMQGEVSKAVKPFEPTKHFG
jgi:hypothetical protein